MTDNILLHLSLISGIGPAVVQVLLDAMPHNQLQDIYCYAPNDFVALGIRQALAYALVDGLADKQRLEQELTLIQKHNIVVVSLLHEAYPALLRQIYLPPTVLYIKGTLPTNNSIAIVGSRNATVYSQQIMDLVVPPLVACNWAVVSGGAIGADAYAHWATIKNNGKTVAVLGSGLCALYPKSNMRLFSAIVQAGGALVSTFPLQAEPLPGNFPARNRVIAGFCRGCLVVQANKKSGALITAQFALQQGREVFAVPGSIFEPLSAGCHDLLAQGAQMATNAQDILQAFGQDLAAHATISLRTEKPTGLLSYCQKPIAVDDLLAKPGYH